MTEVVRAEQQTAPERLFVRVRDWRGAQAIVLSQPQGWDEASLDFGEIRLSDGTLLQVGKSTDLRDDVLARFRAALGLVTLSIFIIALTGGALATQSALRADPQADLRGRSGSSGRGERTNACRW